MKTFYIGNSRQALLRACSFLSNFLIGPKDDYELVLQRRVKSRSGQQNRRYWAILNEIAGIVVQGERYTAEVWHEYFKVRFIGAEDVRLPNGKVITRPLSTTDLDVIQFGEYMEQIEAWAAQHGLLLTDPMAA